MRFFEPASLFMIVLPCFIPMAVLAQDREIKVLASTLAEALSRTPMKTVAVVDFTDLQGNVTELGRFLAEELSVALASTDTGIEVIDRTHLKALLQEHKLAATGVIDPATARRLGEIAGVQVLVTGTITLFGDSVRSSVKALDTATARIITASTTDIPRTKRIEELASTSISPAPSKAGTSGGSSNEIPRAGAMSDGQTQRTGQSDAIPPVSVDEFLFRVRGCTRSGSRVRCSGTVTNTGPNVAYIYFRSSSSYTLDDLGTQVSLGNSFVFGSGNGQNMLPDLTVAFSLVVDDVSMSATEMSIILVVEGSRGPSPTGRRESRVAAMKNVPIVESSNRKR